MDSCWDLLHGKSEWGEHCLHVLNEEPNLLFVFQPLSRGKIEKHNRRRLKSGFFCFVASLLMLCRLFIALEALLFRDIALKKLLS